MEEKFEAILNELHKKSVKEEMLQIKNEIKEVKDVVNDTNAKFEPLAAEVINVGEKYENISRKKYRN